MGQTNSVQRSLRPLRWTVIDSPDALKPMYNNLVQDLKDLQARGFQPFSDVKNFVGRINYYNQSYDTIANRITQNGATYEEDWVFDPNLYPPKIKYDLDSATFTFVGETYPTCNPNETLAPTETNAPTGYGGYTGGGGVPAGDCSIM